MLSKKKRKTVETSAGTESFGERLARLRKERGLTQVELARILDTTQVVISDYERGVLRVHGEVIIRLAAALEVTGDVLLGLEQQPAQAPTKDRRLARRLQAFDSLPKRDRDALTRTIDAFLSARGAA